ncbi:MAG: PHP domain-containing protein [Anaerolineae bacterium]|nr:PHP domain-containing protein [Anaerolineae bacterium]
MSQRWKVELHSHTQYSKDSLVRPETFIAACRRRGLDRVVVTDHNTAQAGLRMAHLAPDLIIPGEEIMTPQGEILAFFVKATIPPMLSPAETIRRLRDQGAFISVSHPFDRLRKGAWRLEDLLQIVDLVDAVEVFNARCLFPQDNARALDFAHEHGKPGTVGSDAHIPYELGRATLRINPFEDAQSFAAALPTATHETRLSPFWVHGMSTYAKRLRKMGLSKMPVD